MTNKHTEFVSEVKCAGVFETQEHIMDDRKDGQLVQQLIKEIYKNEELDDEQKTRQIMKGVLLFALQTTREIITAFEEFVPRYEYDYLESEDIVEEAKEELIEEMCQYYKDQMEVK